MNQSTFCCENELINFDFMFCILFHMNSYFDDCPSRGTFHVRSLRFPDFYYLCVRGFHLKTKLITDKISKILFNPEDLPKEEDMKKNRDVPRKDGKMDDKQMDEADKVEKRENDKQVKQNDRKEEKAERMEKKEDVKREKMAGDKKDQDRAERDRKRDEKKAERDRKRDEKNAERERKKGEKKAERDNKIRGDKRRIEQLNDISEAIDGTNEERSNSDSSE